jgi:hypothetical protein
MFSNFGAKEKGRGQAVTLSRLNRSGLSLSKSISGCCASCLYVLFEHFQVFFAHRVVPPISSGLALC